MPFVPPPPKGGKLTKPPLGLVAISVAISVALALLIWWMASAPAR
jgi:hypothetical protein